MLPAWHGWQLGYPTGVWYTMRTKFLPKRFQISCWLWLHVVIQYGQSRMTRTERRQAHRPKSSDKLSICSARWMGWKNSEHRTRRTRWATNSRRLDKTTERTKRKKKSSWQWIHNVLQYAQWTNERKWYHWEWTIDDDAMGYLKAPSGFFGNWIAEKCERWNHMWWWTNSHLMKKRASTGKAWGSQQWRYTLRRHESSLRYTARLSSGQSHGACMYLVNLRYLRMTWETHARKWDGVGER